MKRRVVSILMAAAISVGLCACGSSEGNTTGSGTSEDSQSQESTASTGEVVEVYFWSALIVDQYNFWTKKANEFNEAGIELDGKKIEVKVQQMPESPSSEAGIQNAIATGTIPAASENVNMGFSATLAESEAIYDIQDEEWYKEIVKNRVMETAVEGWALDGKQYVIPEYINPMSLEWNVKALEIMGIDVPKTMDDFKGMIEAFMEHRDELSAAGISHTFYRPALLRSDQWWERWYDFQQFYQSLNGGGKWVDGDQLTFTQEGMETTLEMIGLLGNTIMVDEIEPLWSADEVAVVFSISAPWEIESLTEAGKVYGEDYVYGPCIVQNAGDTAYSFGDSKGIVFYKNKSISEEEHNGAVAFVSWVYSAENSAQSDLEFFEALNMMPVRGDIDTNEVFAEKMAGTPAYVDLATYIPNTIPAMAHSKMTEIQEAFTEAAMVPYISEVITCEPLNAPDAKGYVEDAVQAMKDAGGLN